MKARTKDSTEGRLVVSTSDHRRYEAKRLSNGRGGYSWMALCESLDPESGRWEPFYTYRNGPDQRCTVHASPDCLDPDGPTFHGRGWDHDGSDPRIECSACTRVMTA